MLSFPPEDPISSPSAAGKNKDNKGKKEDKTKEKKDKKEKEKPQVIS